MYFVNVSIPPLRPVFSYGQNVVVSKVAVISKLYCNYISPLQPLSYYDNRVQARVWTQWRYSLPYVSINQAKNNQYRPDLKHIYSENRDLIIICLRVSHPDRSPVKRRLSLVDFHPPTSIPHPTTKPPLSPRTNTGRLR